MLFLNDVWVFGIWVCLVGGNWQVRKMGRKKLQRCSYYLFWHDALQYISISIYLVLLVNIMMYFLSFHRSLVMYVHVRMFKSIHLWTLKRRLWSLSLQMYECNILHPSVANIQRNKCLLEFYIIETKFNSHLCNCTKMWWELKCALGSIA